jgi:hypothetical protein
MIKAGQELFGFGEAKDCSQCLNNGLGNNKNTAFWEVPMTTALEYLKANPVFHIATVDGTKARVRPFGFVMKKNGVVFLH